MSNRKKPSAGFWITVALVAILVGYPLSLIPLLWLDSRDMIPEENTAAGQIVWAYCARPDG